MATYVNPGLDASGNGNNWTPVNINWTGSGSTFDTMTDVPTLTSATTANYAVLNPINNGTFATISSANLNFTNASGASNLVLSTIGVSSGKWYCEATALGSDCMFGITNNSVADGGYVGQLSTGYGYYQTGSKYNNGSATAYGASYTTNDVIGIALDLDAGTVVFYKNGTSQGTAFSGLSGTFFFATGNGAPNSIGAFNFGQRPFAYTPPTGFVALNTFNLPTPTIGATASTQANKYMDATLFTSAGTTDVNVVNAGGFAPDLVWFKDRSTGSTWHTLVDRVRGNNLTLSSNQTDQEYNILDNGYTGRKLVLNSNGFTINDAYNAPSPDAIVGWQWKESASAGFDISIATSNASSIVTYNHSLGVSPSMVISKSRSTTAPWLVYHQSLGNNQYLVLNSTAAAASLTGVFSGTSTQFTITNQDPSANYVSYLFSEVAGYSKFGSYTGNASTTAGPFIYCGFRPRYVMVKCTSAAGQNWVVWDSSRSPFNLSTAVLYPNGSDAEGTATVDNIDIVSNGFRSLGSSGGSSNNNGATYIFMAFAESPFKYSNAR